MTEPADHRFPRSARLLTPAHYRQVFDQVEIRAGNRHLLILARPSATERPRIGLIIAKRHVRKAVQRNRIKRLLRESFRHRQATLPPLDLVVLARPGLGQVDNQTLNEMLEQLWHKLTRKAQETAGS
ncbi:MAG: ribonuclease P protein component [Halomonadaceae bacterium]|nr:MAG: ribonuclease P protein component [Halomonadaceae bacterium]